MERNAEYLLLKEELNHTPGDLEFTLSRACARLRQKKRLRIFTVPARAILALAVAFVLLVNLSWSFALACSRLPVISDLAAAVALSPSLKAAVENGYVQELNMQQSRNGLTIKLEYMVVDQKQVNIYFRYYDENGKNYCINEAVDTTNGTRNRIIRQGISDTHRNGELQRIHLEYGSDDVPSEMTLYILANEIISEGPHEFVRSNKQMRFEFNIKFDPNFTRKAEVYTPNQSFTIDGQTFTITSVEVFPTQMRIYLEADESNTAWIKELYCYAEDENGVRYEPPTEGITAVMWNYFVNPMHNGFLLDSAYFSKGKQLTLHILGVALLDKDASIKIDLENNTAQGLPDEITFVGAQQKNELVELHFSVQHREDMVYRGNGWGLSLDLYFCSVERQLLKGHTEYDPQTQEELYLIDAGGSSVVYLRPAYSELVAAQSPISIKIK